MSEQDGSPESAAFDRLYRQHGSPVRNFLRVLLGNPSVADDLTQETFLHLWRRPHSFDPKRGSIKNYLLGIARRKAADWWRHNKPEAASVGEPAIHFEGTQAIRDALNQLPESMRTVLWLREVEGYSYEELADILKVPVGTVRSRLHSARRQLRSIWVKEAK